MTGISGQVRAAHERARLEGYGVRFLANKSLQTQLILTGLGCVVVVALVALFFSGSPGSSEAAPIAHLRLLFAITVSGFLSVGIVAFTVRLLLRPLRDLPRELANLSDDQAAAEHVIAALPATPEFRGLKDAFGRIAHQLAEARRAHDVVRAAQVARVDTVDRLLEFSQTIQGAGKPDQIHQTLCHYLRAQLGLAGAVVLTHEPESMPTTQVRASFPDDLITGDRLALELETSLCPCLRQNLPRHFRADGSPVRCGIDAALKLDASHPAYCVPFNVGGKSNVLVHMLLPAGDEWTDERKQLAQTYVNTAHSALISLHLLSEAEKQSMTDGLTGLFNRRSLDQLMQREVALAERHKHALSVVMIDMDKFKEINDAHGHAAGDHLLKAFADCVRITLRKTDLAFRYGGDEFVIALPQTSVAQAQQVVQKLRQAFASVDFSDAISNLSHQPTLSVGVAERSANGNILTLPSILAAVDAALYEAKNNNRNCVRVYQPPQAA
jgi:diguanylate cyclase (GGDEF)-like protein